MLKFRLMIVLLCAMGFLDVDGSSTATATVTYTIGSIDTISLSGNPAPLVISTATAGSTPSNCGDCSTTYAVTTNNSNRRITGALTSPMPLGVTLTVNLQAPTGAVSAGDISLTTTAQDLVTGISNVSEGSLSKMYTLGCTLTSGQISGATNTITYTIGP